MDRLGRSLIDVLNTVKLLRERGIEMKSISDGIDPTTTSGLLTLNMLATLAEYERELITERVSAGIVAAKRGGTRFGRPLSDPVVIADKLRMVTEERAKGASSRTLRALSDGAGHRCTSTSKPTPYARQRHSRRHETITEHCQRAPNSIALPALVLALATGLGLAAGTTIGGFIARRTFRLDRPAVLALRRARD